MKNTKVELSDNELEEVNGGVMPIIVFASNTVPAVEPVPLTPEYEKVKSERNTLIPIP